MDLNLSTLTTDAYTPVCNSYLQGQTTQNIVLWYKLFIIHTVLMKTEFYIFSILNSEFNSPWYNNIKGLI